MERKLEKIKERRDQWYKERIEKKGVKIPPRFNPAGIPIELLYSPLDVKDGEKHFHSQTYQTKAPCL